ncbi:radial spoke head 14 homolog isoform X1 [Leptonychotes weddellii]|uniref:Radial spoke head 14 homolog isoform X1 n=1 Tax=Leptonychotes weddellii TaxID=9713 RepID=A0A7F8RJC9_LEPWE|nr:radial spoke head 14 homolog isoform X1 [Leptonychotes weddellii]
MAHLPAPSPRPARLPRFEFEPSWALSELRDLGQPTDLSEPVLQSGASGTWFLELSRQSARTCKRLCKPLKYTPVRASLVKMQILPVNTFLTTLHPLGHIIRITPYWAEALELAIDSGGLGGHPSPGAQGIVNSGLIPSLVWKLQREEEEIQGLLLDTLAACLMEDATEALSTRVVPFLKQKLLSTDDDIRSKAARTLMVVSIPLEGKNQVWQHDVIPILVHLLKDKVEEVQANAAGALMYAAVTTQGKYAALDIEAIHPLLNLLCSSLTKARLNATKALTMLAEAPEGRKFLQSQVPIFRTLEEDRSEAVRRAAQIAIKVIEWKP